MTPEELTTELVKVKEDVVKLTDRVVLVENKITVFEQTIKSYWARIMGFIENNPKIATIVSSLLSLLLGAIANWLIGANVIPVMNKTPEPVEMKKEVVPEKKCNAVIDEQHIVTCRQMIVEPARSEETRSRVVRSNSPLWEDYRE